jgi:hypothetical protein
MTISLMFRFANATPPSSPQTVAIYYGYPSLVNGARGDLNKAAHVFNEYRIMVLGDGLELPSHAEHNNVVALIPKLTNARVFGYVCIGLTQKLPIEEVQNRVLAWKRTGAQGVFLDEAGKDFGVEHERREQIIDFIHAQGLSAFVNAFLPDDVFAEGTHLGKGDFYLLESFVVRMGELDSSALMSSRVQQALRYRDRYKIGLVGITTTTSIFSPTLYREACNAAENALLDGFGWGEPSFSSQSNSLSNVLLCVETMPRLVKRGPIVVAPEPPLLAGARR